ncbi:MAG: hypothetical protein KY468_07960 [Armatimonadetes bacterium]|nr:hypothetical protein [Armatimonadota bacterium]
MRVTEVVFHENRIVRLTVEMPDPERCTTDKVPHLPRMLFRMFPHLEHHECDNLRGYSFRQESRCTEIPHLLEHLIIELQGQVSPHSGLSGETQWNWMVDPRGRFHVYVQYENELLVLAAIRLAEKIINALDNRELGLLDLTDDLDHLREIARLGRSLGLCATPVPEDIPLA